MAKEFLTINKVKGQLDKVMAKVVEAGSILAETIHSLDTMPVVQVLNKPEAPKKTGKKRGRKPGSKNKSKESGESESSPPAGNDPDEE